MFENDQVQDEKCDEAFTPPSTPPPKHFDYSSLANAPKKLSTSTCSSSACSDHRTQPVRLVFENCQVQDEKRDETFNPPPNVTEQPVGDHHDVLSAAIHQITDILPLLVEKLHGSKCLTEFVDLCTFIAADRFSVDNIAFRLLLEAVRWFSLKTTTNMWYSPETMKFWKVGYRLMKDKFILFMGGMKNLGQLVSGESTRGCFDPASSNINFAVPSPSSLRGFNCQKFPKRINPGVIQQVIDLRKDEEADFIISVDGKKLVPGIDDHGGDIDLFGHETHDSAAEDRKKCISDLENIENTEKILHSLDRNNMSTEKLTSVMCHVQDRLEALVRDVGHRIRDIRGTKLKQEMALERLNEKKNLSGENPYAHAMSSIRSNIHQIDDIIRKSLHTIGQLANSSSILRGSHDFAATSQVTKSSQHNWISLKTPDMLPVSFQDQPRFIQQRSTDWHKRRSEFKVTGSTLHNALGLRTVKEQKQHYDHVYHGKKHDISPEVQERMNYGTENEVHAIATLTGIVLPFLYPDLMYVEEGSYTLGGTQDTPPFMYISPDGSLQQKMQGSQSLQESDAVFACEFKCPSVSKYKLPVYYEVPHYYVCQLLSEMAALKTKQLIFLSYSKTSATVFLVHFDDDLWNVISHKAKNIYQCLDPKRPTKKPYYFQELNEKLRKFTDEKVTFLGEFPSCQLVTEQLEIVTSASDCPFVFAGLEAESSGDTCHALDLLMTSLSEAKQCIRILHNLCRKKATEVLVWLLQDTNREWKPERPHSIPIAYALKGYSLTAEVMRNMSNAVVLSCIENGIKVVGMAFDGQFINLLSRDSHGQPMTLLQLQKDVWNHARKKNQSGTAEIYEDIGKD